MSETPCFFPKFGKTIKIWWGLRKNCFSSNAPQDTVNALWTLLPLSLLLRWKFSSARSPKRWTNLYVFQQNCFSSKHSLDTRNTIMKTFANNSRKFVFFSAQSPEKLKKKSTFFSKSNFPQGVLWTQKTQFGFSAESVLLKTELVFGSKWKSNRSNVIDSRKTVFSENVIRTRTKQCWHFWRQSFCCNQFFFCSNSKNGQKCMLFSKTIFPQSVCWTKRHFWKHCLNFLC